MCKGGKQTVKHDQTHARIMRIAEVMKCAPDLPLPLGLYTCFVAVSATLVLVDADVLLSSHRVSSTIAVFLSDADVLAVSIFLTGRAGLVRILLLLTFPSSALDCDVLFRLDLGGLFSLFVLIGRRKDAERDSVRLLVSRFLQWQAEL